MLTLNAVETKHSIFKSFKFAFDGLYIAIQKGRNFRIQILLGALAIVTGLILKISAFEWIDLTLIIASVLILELINTSLEAIVDIVSPEIREKAKIAKDVSAAAVLIASVAAVVIGGLIFLQKVPIF
jgi:diacylglycerol kinase